MHTPRALALMLGFALTGLAQAADPLPRATPESVGMSSSRLQRIGTAVRAEIDGGRMPGAVVAIARKGRLVYYEAFGWRDKDAKVPMTTDTIFNIASMTKVLTAAGALTLYEEGRLPIGDPVGKYLPALASMKAASLRTTPSGETVIDTVPARPITIQDLYRHTSGLTYGGRGATPVHKLYPASSSSAANQYSGAEFIEALSKLPLLYQPGTVWDYGFSIDVLGIVAQSVSGQPLGRFLDERIFKPLGMVDTGFIVPAEKLARYAKALASDPDTGRPQAMQDLSKPTRFECGGGCAVSTASDYLKFAQMLANKGRLGNTRVLGRKTVEYMTSDHLGPDIRNNVGLADPPRVHYGFGLGVAVRKDNGVAVMSGSAGEYAWPGASGTNFWVDPKEELVVVMMAHTPGALRWHYRQFIAALVTQALVD